MRRDVKIAIDRIENSPAYEERRSRWIDQMDRDLRRFVAKAGIVRVIVRKRGDRYVLVVGHHLLKAARECGLKEAYAHVIDGEARRGRQGFRHDFLLLRSGIEEILCGGATRAA
jgi:hypothetical protein